MGGRHGQLGQGRFLAGPLDRAIFVEAIRPQQGAQSEIGSQIKPGRCVLGQVENDRRGDCPRPCEQRTDPAAGGFGTGRLNLIEVADADQENPIEPSRCLDHKRVVGLAGELRRGDCAGQLTARGPVEGLALLTQPMTFENDEDDSAAAGKRGFDEGDLHRGTVP